jgi:hypothetical protein
VKYATEMGSGAMIYIYISPIKVDSKVVTGDSHRGTQAAR